jgi:hypothetical protein
MSKRASTNSNPLVVFLRGANAIGSRVFSPVALASKLSRPEVQNIGAAGTFIVRAQMPPAKVCAAFERRALMTPMSSFTRWPKSNGSWMAVGPSKETAASSWRSWHRGRHPRPA